MTYIYYTIINAKATKKNWQQLLQQMPPDIQGRVQRYRKEENQYQLVYGRLLLTKLLQDIGHTDFELSAIQYTEHKKPFWKAGIHFSIAHSGKLVACAVSTQGSIGIDVERIQSLPINDFQHILNASDQEKLANSEDVFKAFFKIWTIKEACSKADGRGLGMDVQRLFIKDRTAVFEDKQWFHYALDLQEGYACHYATAKDIEAEVRLVNWDYIPNFL